MYVAYDPTTKSQIIVKHSSSASSFFLSRVSQLSTPWDLLRLDWSMLRDYCCRGGAESQEQANVSVIYDNMLVKWIASEKSGQTVKHPLYLVG